MEVVGGNYPRTQFSLVCSLAEHRAINLRTKFARARNNNVYEKNRTTGARERERERMHENFADRVDSGLN